MSFLDYGLTMRATLWSKTGQDGFSQPIFATPTTIACRWEDRNTEITTPAGLTILSRSRVFLGIDVAVGDFLFLGTSVVTDPHTVPYAFEVKDFRRTPSLDGLLFERQAYLGAA